jgi:1,4-dihydroxy-2-naphthoyl-CoA hydrolase
MARDKPIWFRPLTRKALNAMNKDTLMEALGIEFVEVGPDFLGARMAVDHRTRQPMGLLHGGASLALAESVCGAAASASVDAERFACYGMEINANHVRAAKSGEVVCTARPAYLGATTQVWQFEIRNASGDLLCTGRQTVAVRPAVLPE